VLSSSASPVLIFVVVVESVAEVASPTFATLVLTRITLLRCGEDDAIIDMGVDPTPFDERLIIIMNDDSKTTYNNSER
jgi:hypothetical protein